MNSDERDELVTELLEARARHTEGPTQARLTEAEQGDIAITLDVAELLWMSAHGAPTLSDDPVAAILGLVADRRFALDPRALAAARKRADLTASQLAARLSARGWKVDARDVFGWENQSASSVPPALIEAIATETHVATDALLAPTDVTADDSLFDVVRSSDLFQQLVDRWAAVQKVSRNFAASTLESRIVATVHRGDRPDADQLLRSLEAFVAAIEIRHES